MSSMRFSGTRMRGAFQPHESLETPAGPGRHTLKIRDGRYPSRALLFQVTDGQDINFNCHGRSPVQNLDGIQHRQRGGVARRPGNRGPGR